MTYQVTEEPEQLEYTEDVIKAIIKLDWFIESDNQGILSACSPARPCDNPIQ